MSGSAIVYTRNRKRTQEVAELLVNNEITATFYHAGLNNDVKDQRQKSWLSGESRVMVATNAFGMGIDKPDVRLVIHVDLPDSPEAYFQEAGRAGRDGQKAYAVLLYAKSDKATLSKRITDTFPDKEYIRKVYEDVNYYFQMAMGDGLGCVREFNLEDFCRKFKYFPVPADSALKILTQAGYLEYPVFTSPSAVMNCINYANWERIWTNLFKSFCALTPEYSRITPLSTRIHLRYVAD